MFFWDGRQAHFLTLQNENGPLGPIIKDGNMELQSQSEMLIESMRKCRIWIPLEILLILDQKILKIEPETAELALFPFNRRSLVR